MDAWIKIFIIMIMFSAMSMVMTYLLVDPLVGLILLGVILTLLVITLEPATGKAMAQVTVPLVVILFVMEIYLTSLQTVVVFDTWMLLVIGFILYMLFMIFTGGSSFMEGGFIDAKVSLKLFPIYGLAIYIATLIDNTNQLTVYIMAGTIIAMMALYFVFLRDYDKWPAYSQFKYSDIQAITDINPKGKVKTGAEIWWARTTGPPIQSGEKVVILSITGITMIVAKPDDVVIGQDH